ncbi:MAG: nucleotidyltransferase domain-containing protein [Candidatus Hydrogenedentes bacterium]|nr:nucleotidyltransferase domain-containing protein [Candidatus Hydrogenedentota bacterium]
MDKAAVLDIIERFRTALEAHGVHGPKIILFGSHATGTAHDSSDIDLAVVSEDFVGKNLWERINLLADAICDVFEPIEAIPFSPEEWEAGDTIMAQIARKGEVVAAR